jgi:hypothetical protein
MIKKEIEGKELKQVLHFRFSFEPRFSEVDKSFSLRPSVLRHVMYTIVDRYDNERETWSKSMFNTESLPSNISYKSLKTYNFIETSIV